MAFKYNTSWPQISEKRYSNSKSWSHFSSPAFYSTAEKLTIIGGPFRVFDSPKLRKKRNHIKCVTIQNQVKVRFKQHKDEFHISFLIKCGPWSLNVCHVCSSAYRRCCFQKWHRVRVRMQQCVQTQRWYNNMIAILFI